MAAPSSTDVLTVEVRNRFVAPFEEFADVTVAAPDVDASALLGTDDVSLLAVGRVNPSF